MTELTPAMKQYSELKKQHKDAVLFFRLWDFYEVFFEDAKICHKLLDLVLTSKNKNSENPIPMAWVPYHSAEKYINKLVLNWYKVAIAEQMSDPVPWRIVEREIVSIITPWTYIQDSKKFNYILSAYFVSSKTWLSWHISRWDFSIWQYWTKSFSSIEDMQKFVLGINELSEIIFDVDFPNKEETSKLLKNYMKIFISVHDLPVDPKKYIENELNIQTISSFGLALEDGRLDSFSLLLNYIKSTQKSSLSNFSRVSFHSQDKLVLFDDTTIKNLEIFSSNYDWNEKYCLYSILNNTQTAGWSRLLAYILSHPINDFHDLNNRFSNINYYVKDIERTKKLNLILSSIWDIPKIISKILYKKLLPSSFIKLRNILSYFFDDMEKNEMLKEIIRLWYGENEANQNKVFYDYLCDLFKDDSSFQDDMNYIREWFDVDIDRLRQIAFHSDDLLLQYQKLLSDKSWVSNVKVKFIINQWYFIEITNKDVENFENIISGDDENFDLSRRNTLKWWQRYSSTYLENIQGQIFQAKDDLTKKEYELLNIAKQKLIEISRLLNEFSDKISWLDIYSSHAILSKEKNYNQAEIIREKSIEIINWRHPVIEEFLPLNDHFISNNLTISSENDQENIERNWILHIITWPNMWGKSTYLRQNALIVLMTHCWFFVPVDSAKIGLVDWIFARIGSWDVITKNQSTFMTEMIEVSNILNNATDRSFVIFDELGRWTATYDGLALTKAILEYIVNKVKCKTLIATHYHELIALENDYQQIKNRSVSVYETDKEVVFMKKIIKWWASKSYWIDVAKLAGIPKIILENARENLVKLESWKTNKLNNWGIEKWRNGEIKNDNLFQIDTKKIESDGKYDKVKSLLDSYEINNLTPLQALQILAKLKEEI